MSEWRIGWVVQANYGHVKLATRWRPEGDALIGEGRKWEYDENHNLVNDSGWQPTGCKMWLDGCNAPDHHCPENRSKPA